MEHGVQGYKERRLCGRSGSGGPRSGSILVRLPSRGYLYDFDKETGRLTLWPGIAADDGSAKKSGPTSAAWIDTNTGFLRAVRAWGPATVWIANQPPSKTAVVATRYPQVVAEAGISGARWVVAFDLDLAGRLAEREEAALGTWKRIAGMLAYFEQHPEWRANGTNGAISSRFCISQPTARWRCPKTS